MRIFLALICSLAVVCVTSAQQQENKQKKPAPNKKPTQTTHHAAAPVGHPAAGGRPQFQQKKPAHVGGGRPVTAGKPVTAAGKPVTKGKPVTAAGKATAAGRPVTAAGKPVTAAGKATAAGKTFKPQRFNLPTKTTPTRVASVNFQQGRRIQGSQNWQGQRYTVFRNYTPQWHDQGWWRGHYNRVVFVYGGWYYWNAGFWFPAWGYAPNAYYAYDGPIYGYNNLPPDQVIANVQTALQQQGYYQGEVDGLLGPQTRDAIAGYQRDHGLYETASIDQPTLESLGMA